MLECETSGHIARPAITAIQGCESVARHAGLAATNGNGAGAVESQLVDSGVLAMLEAVRTGVLEPGVAAMQLRERSAGYQQVRPLTSPPCCSRATAQQLSTPCCLRSQIVSPCNIVNGNTLLMHV